MSTNFTDKMNLEEFTKCYICMGKLVEATMCPHCNKLSCNKCIQKWLADRKSSCPYCRMSLKYSQIVHCRFINDLTSMIESISSKKPSNENCNEHKIPLLYYCNQCLEPLCSDCFMFGKKHKDHDIKHLDLIYKNHLELIKNETKDLQSKLDNLNHILTNIEEKITLLKHAKQERSSELDELFENLKKKLDSLMREKLLSLIKTKTLVSDKIEDFDKKKIEINKKLADSHHSQLIANSEDYIKILKSLGVEEDIFKDCLNISVNFESDISPPYESTIFTIKEYKKLLSSTTSKDILYSTELTTNGLIWRLKIYPNGNGVAKGEYISIFLELIDGLIENSKYFYKIELCNYLDNKPNYSREFSSDFHNGECWGYNRFYKIDLLEREGFIDPISGNLSLKYYVKPLTYSQLCRDQKVFIEKMEKQLIAKQQNRKKKEKEKILNENENENQADNKNVSNHLEEVKIDNKETNIEKIETEVIENRLDNIDPEKNDIVLNIKDQNIDDNNNHIDLPLDGEKLNINDLITNNNIESNAKLMTENKEIDDENPLTRSENLIIIKSENLKSSTNVDNISSKNREIDEAIFLLNEKKNIVNYQPKEELNFKINYAEQKQKREFPKLNEIENKQFKAQEEEKLDFAHHQDNKDLSSEFNIVSKQNGSSDNMFDKQIPNILNDDSLNFFKENIKSNVYTNNLTVKQEYEDPFSKKLNLKTSNTSVRKETNTENRINDIMSSLFPESSQRNQSKNNKPSSSVIDNQTLHPSSMSNNNCSIFEKNKFNNYEKLRYILKENKLKSSKKNNK